MTVRYNYIPPQQPHHSIMGCPPDQVGKLCYEGWGRGRTKFVPINTLVTVEATRRKLDLQNYVYDMITYGYIDRETMENVEQETVPTGFFMDGEKDLESRELESDLDSEDFETDSSWETEDEQEQGKTSRAPEVASDRWRLQ